MADDRRSDPEEKTWARAEILQAAAELEREKGLMGPIEDATIHEVRHYALGKAMFVGAVLEYLRAELLEEAAHTKSDAIDTGEDGAALYRVARARSGLVDSAMLLERGGARGDGVHVRVVAETWKRFADARAELVAAQIEFAQGPKRTRDTEPPDPPAEPPYEDDGESPVCARTVTEAIRRSEVRK